MVYTNLIGSMHQNLSATLKEGVKADIKACRALLLEQYTKGSMLEGTLSKVESGYVLELESGIRLPVSILESVEIGKLLQFIVQEHVEGKLQLALVKEVTQELTQKVLEELRLPYSEDMAKCTTQFMDKSLPLLREHINQTYYLHKHYKIPIEVIINMLAKSSPLTEKELKSLSYIKEYGIEKIIVQIKQALLEETSIVGHLEVLDTLLGQLDKETVKKVIKDQSSKDSCFQYTKASEEVDKFRIIADKVHQLETLIKEKEGVNYTIDKEKLAHFFKIESLLLLEIDLSQEGIRKLIDKLYDHMHHIGSKTNTKHVREHILEKGKELSNLIERLGEKTLKTFSPQQREAIKESLQTLQKLNIDGEYFIFPFMSHQQVHKGEIYFFEPSSRQAKYKKNTYIVVALDMDTLKHIEIHINKVDRQISLHIITESHQIKQYVASHIERLIMEVQQMDYYINQCTYTVKEEESLSAVVYPTKSNMTAFDMTI